jgi:hypothetical protein
MHPVFVISVAASLQMVIGSALSAQEYPTESGYCGYFNVCGENMHSFTGQSASSKNAHGDCYGPCALGYVCHPICSGSFAGRPELEKVYIAILAAANAKNVAKVISLANTAPGYVAFSRERLSKQMLAAAKWANLVGSTSEFLMTLRD